jgi:aspartate/methionine/tyrosine aminotransferase
MVAAFAERRQVIVSELNAIPGFSCVEPGGAFYAFPNITHTRLSSRQLEAKLLDEGGVATLSGTSFGAHGEGYLRFSYANSIDNIREAMRRIRACLAQAPEKGAA